MPDPSNVRLIDLDLHDWSAEPAKCRDYKCTTSPHNLKCGRCGTTRKGPFFEHGNHHYFTYVHPDGKDYYHVPPCSLLPTPEQGEVIEIEVDERGHTVSTQRERSKPSLHRDAQGLFCSKCGARAETVGITVKNPPCSCILDTVKILYCCRKGKW